jgi:hypothetical protein
LSKQYSLSSIDVNQNQPYRFSSEVLSLVQLIGRVWGTHCHSLPLGQLYPQLSSVTSFDDLLTAASIYQDVNVQKIAADAAHSAVTADPRVRIDRNLITRHQALAAPTQAGACSSLLPLLRTMSEALAPISYQPGYTLPPNPAAHLPSLPPFPDERVANQRFADLAAGSSVLLHDSFVPSTSLPPPPVSDGLALAVEILARKDHALGRSLILPAAEAISWAHMEGLRLNLSYSFIVRKTDFALGRLVVNYSGHGPNHPDKKELLANEWGPILYPRIADYCATLLTTAARFPGQPLVAVKTDFDSWYKHIRVDPVATPLLAYVIYIDTAPYVVIPLTEVFGSQDSNYHSNFGGNCIYAQLRARAWARFNGDIGHLYSDDHVEWVPESLALEELDAIACIADATAGADTIQSSKTEVNAVVDCIGARFDARSMEVAPTSALFLKLICLVFLEAPSPLRAGDLVRVAWLQRLSSYFILAADFIPPLRPFSRGAAHNTAGREAQRSVPLASATIVDIHFWQAVLLYSFSDATWLVQPVAIPPLFRELPGETSAERSARQASTASLIIYSDACKDARRRGLGFVITDCNNNLLLWGKHMLPPTSLLKADINVLECLAAVLALDAASSLSSFRGPTCLSFSPIH